MTINKKYDKYTEYLNILKDSKNDIQLNKIIALSILPNVRIYNRNVINSNIEETLNFIKKRVKTKYEPDKFTNIEIELELESLMRLLNIDYGIIDNKNNRRHTKDITQESFIFNALQGCYMLNNFKALLINKYTIFKKSIELSLKIDNMFYSKLMIDKLRRLTESAIILNGKGTRNHSYDPNKHIISKQNITEWKNVNIFPSENKIEKYLKVEEMIAKAAIFSSKTHNKESVKDLLNWAAKQYYKIINQPVSNPHLFMKDEIIKYVENIIVIDEESEIKIAKEKIFEEFEKINVNKVVYGTKNEKIDNKDFFIRTFKQSLQEDKSILDNLNRHINYGSVIFESDNNKKLTLDEQIAHKKKEIFNKSKN